MTYGRGPEQQVWPWGQPPSGQWPTVTLPGRWFADPPNGYQPDEDLPVPFERGSSEPARPASPGLRLPVAPFPVPRLLRSRQRPGQSHRAPRSGLSWTPQRRVLMGLALATLLLVVVVTGCAGPSVTGSVGISVSPARSATHHAHKVLAVKKTPARPAPAATQAPVPVLTTATAPPATKSASKKTAASKTVADEAAPAAHTTAPATHTTAPSAQAPVKVPPTEPAPPPVTPTSAGATTAPPPPTAAAPVSCHPLTSGGNCYEPGEFCRDSDHGASGVAGDGKAITCEDNDGWRWEPA